MWQRKLLNSRQSNRPGCSRKCTSLEGKFYISLVVKSTWPRQETSLLLSFQEACERTQVAISMAEEAAAQKKKQQAWLQQEALQLEPSVNSKPAQQMVMPQVSGLKFCSDA